MFKIYDKTVDKSVAVARILKIENFNFDKIIFFGNGYNDEKMLIAAGLGLVMANAPESLKSKLSHLEVISTNDDDGLVKFLSKRVLNRKTSTYF
jgi:hydroxymethylpyrimidine pyrophosphatase-like HAD family hydrolase